MTNAIERCRDNLFQLLSHYDRKGEGIDTNQVDSFEFVQIMLEIEEAYDIEFELSLMTFETLQDITALAAYIVQNAKLMTPFNQEVDNELLR